MCNDDISSALLFSTLVTLKIEYSRVDIRHLNINQKGMGEYVVTSHPFSLITTLYYIAK